MHIEPSFIEDTYFGDIALFRTSGRLFEHWVFAKGVDDGRPCIATRPDPSNPGNDQPIRKQNALGVFSKIERKGKQVSAAPIPPKSQTKARVMICEWWGCDGKLCLINGLEWVQRLRMYRTIASPCLKALKPHIHY